MKTQQYDKKLKKWMYDFVYEGKRYRKNVKLSMQEMKNLMNYLMDYILIMIYHFMITLRIGVRHSNSLM